VLRLCRLRYSQSLPFPRLLDSMKYVAMHQTHPLCMLHGPRNASLTLLVCRAVLHRVKSELASRDSVRAGSTCLVALPKSAGRSSAPAANLDIIEACPSYSKVWLASLQLLVMLLLLPHALPPLLRLLCYCHQQECITLLATHVPSLQPSVMMLLRALLPSLEQIRP
jgi:hypothetical protein